MKIATIITRSLLGSIFVVFGSNIFLNFIPMPPPPEGTARDFMTAMFLSHYIYVVGALQVVGGLLLFTGRWTPLARIFHSGIEERSGEGVRRLDITQPNENATHRFFCDRL